MLIYNMLVDLQLCFQADDAKICVNSHLGI